jgi:hypothetical protein
MRALRFLYDSRLESEQAPCQTVLALSRARDRDSFDFATFAPSHLLSKFKILFGRSTPGHDGFKRLLLYRSETVFARPFCFSFECVGSDQRLDSRKVAGRVFRGDSEMLKRRHPNNLSACQRSGGTSPSGSITKFFRSHNYLIVARKPFGNAVKDDRGDAEG